MLAIVRRAGALEELPGRRARSEMLLGKRAGSGDEVTMRGLELREDVRELCVLLGVDEPGVPRVEIVIGDAVGIGRLILPETTEGGDHLAMPPGHVDRDLSCPPGAEPHLSHGGLVETADGFPQLPECFVRLAYQLLLVCHGSLRNGRVMVPSSAR